MKYAKEVIDLLAAYPGREFRMIQIVRHIDLGATGSARQRVRNGVLRVLQSLEEHGQIECTPAEKRGGYSTYAWKVPHHVRGMDAKVPARVP